MADKVPHFSIFEKNYSRRFKDTDLFEQSFSHILQECYKFKLIGPSEVFVDATHVKARANNKKMQKHIAREETLFFEDLLKKEITKTVMDTGSTRVVVSLCRLSLSCSMYPE